MKLRWLLSMLAIVCVLLMAWGFWWEPASLTQAEYRLALPRWPAACAGLRVVVLADLHVGAPFHGVTKLDRIVTRSMALQPDLILLAGDFVIQGVVGGHFVAPEVTAERLKRLTAPLGVFAVLGNHDWWHGGPSIRQTFEHHGIPVLEDTAVPLAYGQCRFWLAGISDYRESRHDVAQALRPIPPGQAVVAFTHNPDVFPDVPSHVMLTIAGHTHGGQVYIPFVGRPIVHSQYGERFAIGHIVEQGRHFFVTPGLGTSILPVRFLVPPEISVLVLSPGEGIPPRETW